MYQFDKPIERTAPLLHGLFKWTFLDRCQFRYRHGYLVVRHSYFTDDSRAALFATGILLIVSLVLSYARTTAGSADYEKVCRACPT